MDYETAKQLARHGSWEQRAGLASDADLPAELLVFLAADSSETVRITLAQNRKLPAAAVRLLARDALLSVRETVAHHVARLWPERASYEAPPAQRLAREALLQLATDTAVTVRTALATAIADVAVAPPEVAERLALDAAEEVAAPILRHYARFNDAFLIDLIAQRSESWARIAIAERKTISGTVSEAIFRTGNATATHAVVQNSGAEILPKSAVRLAGFIDESLYNSLAARGDFDTETLREIVETARRRVDWAAQGKVPAILRVRDLWDEGRLNDDAIRDALAWRDEEFTRLALAVLARIPPDKIAAILASDNPKGVTAISWRAGLAARTALALQKTLNGIPPHRFIHPKGGSDYALSETEMLWQLEFYGIAI